VTNATSSKKPGLSSNHYPVKEFTLKSTPPAMIRNYLKVALRSIFRNKLTAFINIAGLALAMSCAVLIYFYVTDEISYDKYHANAARTYRITRDFLSADGTANLKLANVAPPIGPLIKNDFGEVEFMARTINYNMVIGLEEKGELKKAITENDLFFAEPDIFKIFDFTVTAGNPSTALERPFTVMLSEEIAKKYFGQENPVGKRLRAANKFDLEVTGVYKSLPAQSHWHPTLLASFSTFNDSTVYGRKGLETNWGNNSFGTYIVLEEGVDPQKLEAQMPGFLDKHFGPYAIANFGAPAGFVAHNVTKLHVELVGDIHLRSHRADEVEVNGNINNVYMMSIIGIFIVMIACFNFVNLSTARATKRSKEVGMRKVVGAFRKQLIAQYLSESVMIAFFALVLAIGFSFLSIGWLNDFTRKHLSLNLIQQWPVLLGLIGFAAVLGLLAGIYPAFVISGFKPATVLKSEQGTTRGKGGIRKTLVVVQFAISIVLIIATAVASQQLDYLNNRNLGYDKDQVITLPFYGELAPSYDAFYNELTKNSLVKNLSRASRVPTGRLLDSYGGASAMEGDSLKALTVPFKSISVDQEFFDSYGMEMAFGRKFSKSIRTDDSLAFIINETAARQIGWKNQAAEIDKDFQYAGVRGKLVGIVRDFHFESLHQPIVPMVFLVRSDNFNTISIKLAGTNMSQGLAYIERVWREFLPKRPFDYQFLSESYQRLYEAEQKQNQLFSIFSGLAIFIACLGLFGLATFNTLLRVKEIGIRKVLGASVPNILALLSKEIVILIVVANLVAWPTAWILMSYWLDSFAYHVTMNFLVYLTAAVLAIAVALLTVSSQSLRAAMSNPTKTLRHE
jgi:putative ABC transport system permease protein